MPWGKVVARRKVRSTVSQLKLRRCTETIVNIADARNNVLYNDLPRRTSFLMAQEDERKNELLQIKDS